jgi:hypothetical protein
MGAPNTITGRLLTYEEAEMHQNIEHDGMSIILDGYQSYWLGSAEYNNGVNEIAAYGEFSVIASGNPSYISHYGIRPVIEIPTSELQ